MRTIALFCAALLGGLGGSVRAADARFGDPGALINPVDTTQIKNDINAGIRFAGFAIDMAEANVILNTHARDFLRGTLADSFLKIQKADPPTLRAVKAFLGELQGVVVACKGRVVIKLPLRVDKTVETGRSYDGFTGRTTVRTQKVPWLNDRYPVSGSGLNLLVGITSDRSDEEAESLGESIIYTFQLTLMDPRVLEAGRDDEGTEMDRWTSLNGALDGFANTPWQDQWQCSVRLRRRAARIEQVLPQPPTIDVLSRLPFQNINCAGIPRMSTLTNILQEIASLSTAEKIVYLSTRSKQGEVDATCQLGRSFFLNGQAEAGVALLEKAASLGSGEAAWLLAESYDRGERVERDREKALRFYTIAADEGYRVLAPKRIEALRAAPDKPSPAER